MVSTNTKLCSNCGEHFPTEGLDTVLPVQVSFADGVWSVLLCLECRRMEYYINLEPFPPGVDEYTDESSGLAILPRISQAEASEEYCMDLDNLRPCLPMSGLPVSEAFGFGVTRMYVERDVLILARWKFGGDAVINNAREVYAEQGRYVNRPLEGAVRERRNRIREAFLERGEFFAQPELWFVKNYVEVDQGDLWDIVETYAVPQ
ncbi:hypothetical protein BGZ96_008254 [Linnemannia gamsii]|uniref:Uncharacterized protein n=1 Tax=Linnemannia gamsii TaxID=64522 RepID=A0ABQ7JYM8_9FUNG|nr:hypothetical protein BGZ96_008254 [Linnemannia gamsii]